MKKTMVIMAAVIFQLTAPVACNKSYGCGVTSIDSYPLREDILSETTYELVSATSIDSLSTGTLRNYQGTADDTLFFRINSGGILAVTVWPGTASTNASTGTIPSVQSASARHARSRFATAATIRTI